MPRKQSVSYSHNVTFIFIFSFPFGCTISYSLTTEGLGRVTTSSHENPNAPSCRTLKDQKDTVLNADLGRRASSLTGGYSSVSINSAPRLTAPIKTVPSNLVIISCPRYHTIISMDWRKLYVFPILFTEFNSC